jgi:hypothetical protein
MGKEISDLKIQYDLMGTEMVRLRAQKPGKGLERKTCKTQYTQTKGGRNAREMLELRKRMEKLEDKHRMLETVVKRIDGPKAVMLSVPAETLQIPREWEKCKLVSHTGRKEEQPAGGDSHPRLGNGHWGNYSAGRTRNR